MTQRLCIIGAGIAGLAAGIYARKAGFDTTIFESHTLPGGLCTAWHRKGYTFDGCIHWLVGSGPGSPFHQIWRETGALPGDGVIDSEVFIELVTVSGESLKIYTDADRLEAHLISLAPEDANEIRTLCAMIRKFSAFDFPTDRPRELATLWSSIQGFMGVLPYLRAFIGYGKLTWHDYLKRYKSAFLRENLGRLFNMEGFPFMGFVFTLASLHGRTAGWPVGGSLPLSRRMAERFTSLGGHLRYNSRVTKITVTEGRAAGIRLESGEEIPFDVVLSAADGRTTLFDLLGSKYLPEKLSRFYDTAPVFDSSLQISYGVRMDLSGHPRSISYRLADPLTVAGKELYELNMRHFCNDATMAPAGCSVVTSLLEGNYQNWASLSRERYEQEKEQVQRQVMARIEERIPGFSDAVEVVDVATPVTFQRYTHNQAGSIMGWHLDTAHLNHKLPRTLPDVRGFYMAGQWTEVGGGLPPAVLSGKEIAQVIAAREQ